MRKAPWVMLAVLVAAPGWSFSAKDLATFKVLNACVGCDLRGAYLSGADMRGADLRGAKLSKATLYRADLRGADLSGADLWRADLRGAELKKADLLMANGEIDRKRVLMWRADLRGANLRGADMRGANLSTAQFLKNAKLDGAVLCKTRMPWGEDNASCE